MLLVVAGIATGATTYARIDSYLTLASFMAFIAVVIVYERSLNKKLVWRRAGLYSLAATATAFLGWRLFTDLGAKYYNDLHVNFVPQVYLLVATLVASFAFVGITSRWHQITSFYKRYRKIIAWMAIVLVGLVIVGLASRPLWMTSYTKSQSGLIASLQAAEGLTVEPRDYTEYSLHWMWWYIGPMAALFATIGVLQAAGKSLRKMDYALVVFFIVFLVPAVVYFVRPSIAADQIWVIRRYLPVIMPGILVFAAVGMQQLELRLAKYKLRNVALLGLSYLMLHPVGFIAGPFYQEREFANMYDRVERTCELLPDDAAVLLLGTNGLNMLQTVRVYCDVPAERITAPTTELLAQAAASATDKGYRPYVLVEERERQAVAGEASLTLIDDTVVLEYQKAATRPPRALSRRARTIYLGELNLDGSINHLTDTVPDYPLPEDE